MFCCYPLTRTRKLFPDASAGHREVSRRVGGCEEDADADGRPAVRVAPAG